MPLDFREFVFTASGDMSKPGAMSPLEVYDNAVVETDRLAAIVALLSTTGDDLTSETAQRLALLLEDIHKRMERILEELVAPRPKGSRPRTSSGSGRRS